MPAAPRTRYALVVTTAVVGAGMVALGTASALPDNSGAIDPSALSSLDLPNSGAGQAAGGTDDRAALADRASRDANRTTDQLSALTQGVPDIWGLPCKTYEITSVFGYRWGVLHAGVDFAVPYGTPIYATHAGTIKIANWYGGYGYAVEINHGGGLSTLYGHNSELVVEVGEHVEVGQLIAYSGSSGYSTGPHSHYEVRVNEKQIDPLPFMLQRGVDIIGGAKHVEDNSGRQLS